MKSFFLTLMTVLLAGTGLAGAASAADRYPFTEARLAQAEASGRPVLVDIAASWCPVCQVQKKIITGDLMKPAFANFVVLDVDFDTQKPVVRQFHATMQSTLIFIRGKTERARLVGGTDPDLIAAMMRRAVD
ncbi:MAG: thioredoxin family protein [Alphaproteobacteria bacterium]|nr:thioredoxin family protein [Alphaproteobacteria bacterium]